ncbi:hypothetical protein J3S89_01055 [Pinisolibacter sp. B13]|uniref:hypothetical protein n=1 Tax=Pinisolibacter aquiterrae TaxID=2815579 RepID=UPI001C3D6C6B|nr:hypothetical protein [Pinisolibacter aquiterrae]MBV5262624.1 hypothetical protein [Pinisolibacter aquiterrae]
MTISIHEHIEELRAELRGCLDRAERQQIIAELGAALAERDRHRETPPRWGRLAADCDLDRSEGLLQSDPGLSRFGRG